MKRLGASLFAAVLALARAADAGDLPDRLFDFRPVGSDNPWVARIDDRVEIPLSELCGYLAATRGNAELVSLGAAARAAAVRELVDEYLLLAAAHAAGSDAQPAFIGRMAHTRRMLLAEMLVGREVGAVAKDADDYAARLARLRDAVFEACPIEVSNEAHAALVAALAPAEQAMSAQDGASFAAVTAKLGSQVLARYPGGEVAARKMLVFALAVPRPERPDAATPAGLTRLLKELLLPELLADVGQDHGIAQTRGFRAKVIENENALRRMFARDQLLREAEVRRTAPTEREVADYFATHRERYGAGASLDAVRSRVESDVVDERFELARERFLARLRAEHRIELRPDFSAEEGR